MPNKHFEYDVAFSFADEDYAKVDCVARKLERKGIHCYDYRAHKNRVKLWGQNLNAYLGAIYRRKSRYCVMFISAHYQEKRWAQYEMKKAKRRAINSIDEYILPYRIDNTPIKGLSDDINYLSSEDFGCEALTEAIYERVINHRQEYRPVPIWRWMLHMIVRPLNAAAFILTALGMFAFIFSDEITPVDNLAKRLYDRSAVHSFAVCRDGHISYAHGRGTCSHHHGVDHYVEDTVSHTRSMEQCQEEAREVSWFAK